MIYGLYFRIYKIIKNKSISEICARIIYFFLLIRFQIKRLKLAHVDISINAEDALKIINEVCPDHHYRYECSNRAIDYNIDLSVIIPVYNYVSLVNECIESVLNQETKYHFELIIIDDGSTDGSREAVLKYQDYPNVTVILQENMGIAGARNTGINHAVGRYLMFIDCDDTVHNNIIDTLMSEAYTNNCDIVMCAHNLSKEKDGTVYDVIPNVYPQKNLQNYKNDDDIMNYAGLPWAKVYRRELWEQVRFFEGYWFEDSIIHFLIFTQCKSFSYVPKICYEYRWYESNFSHIQGKKVNKKNLDRYWLVKAMLNQYQRMELPTDKKFYTMLLKHLSAHYYPSIEEMDEKVIEAMFVLACELLDQYRVENCQLPYVLRVTEKAMINRDIELWKLSSKYQ